jgi:DNA polymerase-3 subunit delta
VWYILHGEEEFGLGEVLGELRAELAAGDPAMAQLNTSFLEGQRLTLGELRHVCDAIPFMARNRLVIVNGLLGWLMPGGRAREGATQEDEPPASKKALLDSLLAYLPKLPDTTWLVFVEGQTLPVFHPILKLAEVEAKRKRACVQEFKRLKDQEVPGWIRQRMRSKGGELTPEATAMLAALVGGDLRLLDQELEKLLLWADGGQVTGQDVQALVSYAREASIFDLVDYVGRRQTDRALRLLHHLLDDGEVPLYLLAMLARQVRILIQVSELRAQGRTPKQTADRLKLHPYVVEKGIAQARNFQMNQLEGAHRQLVETDWRIKTGELDEELALDMLVVTLTRT